MPTYVPIAVVWLLVDNVVLQWWRGIGGDDLTRTEKSPQPQISTPTLWKVEADAVRRFLGSPAPRHQSQNLRSARRVLRFQGRYATGLRARRRCRCAAPLRGECSHCCFFLPVRDRDFRRERAASAGVGAPAQRLSRGCHEGHRDGILMRWKMSWSQVHVGFLVCDR